MLTPFNSVKRTSPRFTRARKSHILIGRSFEEVWVEVDSNCVCRALAWSFHGDAEHYKEIHTTMHAYL